VGFWYFDIRPLQQCRVGGHYISLRVDLKSKYIINMLKLKRENMSTIKIDPTWGNIDLEKYKFMWSIWIGGLGHMEFIYFWPFCTIFC